MQSKIDYKLFIQTDGKDLTMLLTYVDDIIIVNNNMSTIDKLRSAMNENSTLKILENSNSSLTLKFHDPINEFVFFNANML